MVVLRSLMSPISNHIRGLALICCTLSLGWGGPQDKASGSGEREMGSFGVARRGTATVEDAYRQFLSMASRQGRSHITGDVDEMSFDEVRAQLESLCLIDASWEYAPNTCLRRDVLAYMTCSYLGCRPGLVTGLCGMTRRYAHREMVYQRVIAPGAPATLVSGSELLSVVTRVSRRVDPRRDVQLTNDEIH
jgi:hypothetical protein